MRTVLIHLQAANEAQVATCLQRAYPSQQEVGWVAYMDGDPCLYIDFYRNGPAEHGPEGWAKIESIFGGAPFVSIAADVSGRHPGAQQVRELVSLLLRAFGGVAEDDYTEHLWTIEEIESGKQMQGHTFFDHAGQ